MELVIRAALTYFFLMVILRISGKRQFSEISTFDFVLLLIISEAVSQGLYGGADYSLTASLLLVTTLVAMDIGLSYVKRLRKSFDHALESKPIMLLKDGELIEGSLRDERVDEDDILSAARQLFGIESLSEVRHAILERDGSISVIPKSLQWMTAPGGRR